MIFILEQFHIAESANKILLSTINALVLVVNAQSPELATPTPEFQEVRIKITLMIVMVINPIAFV